MICTLGVLAVQGDVVADPPVITFEKGWKTEKGLKTRKGQTCLCLKQEGEKHRMTLVIKDCQLTDL